jgi:glycosyltransferase involved in cell wall biosynthesis
VLEALATGRPALLSDHPQFRALGDAVVRVPQDDPAAAGRELGLLLQEPRRWDLLAERGRHAVQTRFGVDRFTTRYADLYRELLP